MHGLGQQETCMSLSLDESGTSDEDEDRETEYTLPDGIKVQASPLAKAKTLEDRGLTP